MDQIEQLLAKFKEFGASELRMEVNQRPAFITPSGPREISAMPIQHKDIVQILAPILTQTVKSDLIEKPETEFQHRSPAGFFAVKVKKSNLGFNVFIRPMGGGQAVPGNAQPIAQSQPGYAQPMPAPAMPVQPQAAASGYAPQQAMPQPQPQHAGIQHQPMPQQAMLQPQAAKPHILGPRAEIDPLFERMAAMGASDLHICVGMPPMVRHDGEMKSIEGTPVLKPEDTERLLHEIMPQRNKDEFERRHDTDFAYELSHLGRFRSNIFMDRKGMGAVFRIIPSKILTAEQLGLSKAIMDLCFLNKGLVVVTGPTGSGKSTTLAAMVDYLNRNRRDHVITIEDPIEFVHENKGCLLNQREVHNHTDSFKDALRAALREDPDIILVGEMRDLETIAIAIETAETGHLVFGTLHTTTAASTIDRIIDQFPADRQAQIRTMLSESLKGVIAQTLLKKKGGGRIAALEVLLVTPAISNLIREGKTFQIASVMQTGRNLGMVTLNDALLEHVKNGLVTAEEAYQKSMDKVGFRDACKRNNMELNF